jgi:hypothetical protein
LAGAAIDAIAGFFHSAWDGLASIVSTIWDGIKTAVITPIHAARDLARAAIEAFGIFIHREWDGLEAIVSTVWNGIKSAITGPIQAAYDFVKDKVEAIGNFINKIPGVGLIGDAAGAIGGLAGKFFADGGIVTQPTFSMLGENYRKEVVIPMTNPGRAMQLMHQSGLDRLAAQMSANTGITGPLVTMPGAVIQDATDADLVAQRTLVAMQAAMVA